MASFLLLGYLLFRRAAAGVPEHVFFGEHQRTSRFLQGLSLQQAPAQQGEFLHRNPMLANQSQIDAHREFTSLAII